MTDIEQELINTIFEQIKNTVLNAIGEEPTEFPYLTNTLAFMKNMSELGIELDFNIFTDIYISNLYKEIHHYLSRK